MQALHTLPPADGSNMVLSVLAQFYCSGDNMLSIVTATQRSLQHCLWVRQWEEVDPTAHFGYTRAPHVPVDRYHWVTLGRDMESRTPFISRWVLQLPTLASTANNELQINPAACLTLTFPLFMRSIDDERTAMSQEDMAGTRIRFQSKRSEQQREQENKRKMEEKQQREISSMIDEDIDVAGGDYDNWVLMHYNLCWSCLRPFWDDTDSDEDPTWDMAVSFLLWSITLLFLRRPWKVYKLGTVFLRSNRVRIATYEGDDNFSIAPQICQETLHCKSVRSVMQELTRDLQFFH